MEPMNTSQTVFALFYAIMWGALANVYPRWKAFDLSLTAYPGGHAGRRWLLSFLLLNFVPILYFVSIQFVLNDWRLYSTDSRTFLKLIVILLQPFALIGFYWVWTAIVQKFRATFYPQPLTPPDSKSPGQYSQMGEEDLESRRARPNLLFGLMYILVPPLALGIISLIGPT